MSLIIRVFAPLSNLLHTQIKQAQETESTPSIAKVTQPIKGSLRGRVKFKNQYFYAICQDETAISRGEHVEVLAHKRTTLIVKRLMPPS